MGEPKKIKESLNFHSKDIVEDLLNFLCRYLRRQQISQNEKSELKFILYHFVPELLNIFDGEMSDDDYDNLYKDTDYKKMISLYKPIFDSQKGKKTHASFKSSSALSKKHISTIKKDFYLLDEHWIIFIKIFNSLAMKLKFIYDFIEDERNYVVSNTAKLIMGVHSSDKPENNVKFTRESFYTNLCEFMDFNWEEEQYFNSMYNIFGMHTHQVSTFDKMIKSAYRQLVATVKDRQSLALIKLNYDRSQFKTTKDFKNACSALRENEDNLYRVTKVDSQLTLIIKTINLKSKTEDQKVSLKFNPFMSPETMSDLQESKKNLKTSQEPIEIDTKQPKVPQASSKEIPSAKISKKKVIEDASVFTTNRKKKNLDSNRNRQHR